MIATWHDRYTSQVIALWNEEAVKDGYKEMTEESFHNIFLRNTYFDRENTFVWLQGGFVQGFACGCTGNDLPLGDVAGYITCIILRETYRTDARFKMLLDVMELRFEQLGKKQAEVLFFNPMQLPWYIPETARHEHNNAPGFPVGSKIHQFLTSVGYIDRATQCAMYLLLSEFKVPLNIVSKEEKAALLGYRVELFHQERHSGLNEMLDGLANPLWKKEINRSVKEGAPVVIAVCNDVAVGFAGPVIQGKNGRGYFAGIGVLPEHEGHGLGSSLFFRLCEAFQSSGTEYMSLYTGSNNPAIRIYEKAGFTTVKTFAIMRRELVQ
ncbi:GNAT family N-acetyltransferase [Paenibacillus sp. GSMTC-2017]|uniref:GNAT family N-acetyltransferase n=1 Tax=Paenibacillus sp. GSMTC-2017 TaxID=2794350 RepID=UPI0018D7FD6E|nr:GNAT family N-acetyltransferase [Paenibacillus sp. GSMTC-2017]MBH5319769.1 GNAT family N-acetyltransferase [Paenibacillus sp. GSMTC-2017]